MAVNPLGTGYYNALTQKLIDPNFALNTDFNKPSSSGYSSGSNNQKGKIYFENGTLINNDYDKISDTNDDDDLDRILELDTMDSAPKPPDTKLDNSKEFEIEDLLNEFNEKQEDMKNSGHIDDFLKDVIGEPAKVKTDIKASTSKSEDTFLTHEALEFDQSAISDLLDKEMEKIDMETKEVEKSRLSAIVSTVSSTVSSSTPSPLTVTTASSSVPVTVSSLAPSVPTVSVPEAKPADPDNKPHQEEHVDFDIPKVGKLQKIRKYVEIQKQKEQTATDKHIEVKIHEKKEPPVEEKPQLQTILVQVSKRKKIEYGPYIDKQSLLQGKPKNMPETSPPKVFRPKPKPQAPVRRTFNLRERRNKPDFATLAGTNTRANDGKGKEKGDKGEKTDKVNAESEEIDVDVKDTEISSNDESKLVTRQQEKGRKKDIDENVVTVTEDKRRSVGLRNAKSAESEKEKDDSKPKLRSRAGKTEGDVTEGKNLRKRNIKSSPDLGGKSKVKKTEVQSEALTSAEIEVDVGNETEQVVETEEKEIKTRSKQRENDKTELKKCSVNLEKLSTSGTKGTKGKLRGPKSRIERMNRGEESSIPLEMTVESESSFEKDTSFDKNVDDDISQDRKSIDIYKKECENPEQSDKEVENILEKVEKVQYEMPEIPQNAYYSVSSNNDNKKFTLKFKLGPEFHKSVKEYMSAPKKRKFDVQKDFDTNVEAKSDKQESEASDLKENVSQESVECTSDTKVKDEELSVIKIEKEVENTTSEPEKNKVSVENEFQRLVDEAMREVKKAQKEGDTGKKERYVNLRKRLTDSVRYNVDDSEDELERHSAVPTDVGAGTPKTQKVKTGKAGSKAMKMMSKAELGLSDSGKKDLKKDVDVYDFTDTEMSDSEETANAKSGFKPKYVSNLHKCPLSMKKLPFVSTPLSESPAEEQNKSGETAMEVEEGKNVDSETKEPSEEKDESSASYDIAKTVDPLKIKLTLIRPFKEKKHKHKKKKKKKDRERKDSDREDAKSDIGDNSENSNLDMDKREDMDTSNVKLDSVRSTESARQESVGNEGEDEQGGDKLNKKSLKMKEKKHICEFCNLGFSQKCDLRRHVMIHTGERPWPCQICDKKFQRKTDLVKHVRTHTGEKPYACDFCDKRVSDRSQLIVHMRLHTGDRPYRCENCGKRCITSSELSRHRAAHCAVKTLSCSECKKVFKLKECLGIHMKLHYLSSCRPYKCEKCSLGFDSKELLDSHKCVDPNNSVYICSECYEEYTDEMLYAEHVKTHDLAVLACNVCTLIFPDKHSLETHLCTLGVDRGSSDSDKTPTSLEDDKTVQVLCSICDMELPDQGRIAV